ncbi:MAG: hypothetical protein WC588_00125 [Candidatus Micrarchaeia archaeon]
MEPEENKVPEDFEQLNKLFDKRIELIRINHSANLQFIEESLTYLLKLRNFLQQKMNAKYSPENRIPNNLAISFFLLDRNILYIYSSYSLFLKSLVDPAKEHERVMLESALVNYSLTHGEFAMQYYEKILPILNQIFDKINSENIDAELLAMHDEWKKSCRNGTTIARLADELYKITDKQRAKDVECELLKIYESTLSLSSHANIINLASNTEIKQENLTKELIVFSSMLIFYLVSLVEIFHEFITEDETMYTNFTKLIDKGVKVVDGRLIPLPNSSKVSLEVQWRKK